MHAGLTAACAGTLHSPLYFAKLRWDLEKRRAAADRDRKKKGLMYGRPLTVCTHKHMYVCTCCSVF